MILQSVLEVSIKLIVYIMFFCGIWLLTKPFLKPSMSYALKNFKHKSKLKLFNKNLTYHENSFIYRHLNLLLQTTWKYYRASSVFGFTILSFGLFLATFAIYFRFTKSWTLTVIGSTFTAALPYIILRMFLQFIRSNTSYQLVPAVGLLLAGYRVCNKDIYFGILSTIKKLDHASLKKSFIILANHIQNHKNNKDIENAVALFVFKTQTSWAKQLGILLLNSLIDGRDIERSLSNIVNDMKEGQKIIEQEKSNSHETILLGYLPLVAFPLTIWFMSTMSGQFNILYHQFKTEDGLASFLITTFLCVIGFLLALIMRKPKNDL